MSQGQRWEKSGLFLWIVGSAAFVVSAARADDPYALAGALLFLTGIVLFMVPMFQRKD